MEELREGKAELANAGHILRLVPKEEGRSSESCGQGLRTRIACSPLDWEDNLAKKSSQT